MPNSAFETSDVVACVLVTGHHGSVSTGTKRRWQRDALVAMLGFVLCGSIIVVAPLPKHRVGETCDGWNQCHSGMCGYTISEDGPSRVGVCTKNCKADSDCPASMTCASQRDGTFLCLGRSQNDALTAR